MKKTIASLWLAVHILVFGAMVLPVPAEAALVPCGTKENPSACTLCHLVVGINGIIQWGLGVMTVIAIVVIVAMAILYIVSAGDGEKTKTAKKGITTSLVGFALMLAAWIIVNTIITILAPNIGVEKGANWWTFQCGTGSSTGYGLYSNLASSTPSTGTGGSGGAACENIEQAKQRLSGGGTVCNNTGTCKSCNTSQFSAYIQQASNKYNIPQSFIKAIIARESSCIPTSVKQESDGTKSCGLMGVNGVASTYSCDQLKNPAIGIDEGTRILAKAYADAQSLKAQYGNTVTVAELAAAIHNAGKGQSTSSVDCKSPDWPTIPKWGCPINPGTAQFNACDIRDYACDVGACVN
jgi:hypothetical protein